MQWIKKGLLFAPSGRVPLMRSHAAVPIAESLGADRVRIYFSARDSENRSHPWAAEWRPDDPSAGVVPDDEPVLALGVPGTFDESGVMPGWSVTHNGTTYLYYTGWNRGVSVPFRNAIGLAISQDGGRTFEKVSRGPILDRSIHDPCFVATPCVIVESGRWRMWYLSAVEWRPIGRELRHRYHIKYAESTDGVTWHRDGTVCIDFKSPEEYAISCPCVVRDRDCYRMWYSYRGDTYRIGYAESHDGISWRRLDERAGIGVSPSGWDSEMVCYGFVFDHHGPRRMLYNGNRYGCTGFGYAVLDPDPGCV